MLKEFAVKFWKVSEESLVRDETPRQTCHELCFHKYLSIPKDIFYNNIEAEICEILRIFWE